jgi:hypothetical protein
MNFEQAQMPVNFLHQAEPLSQRMNGAQSTTTHRAGSLGDFIMNIAALEHGLGLIGVILFAQTPRDLLLGLTERSGVGFFHSKCAFSVLG